MICPWPVEWPTPPARPMCEDMWYLCVVSSKMEQISSLVEMTLLGNSRSNRIGIRQPRRGGLGTSGMMGCRLSDMSRSRKCVRATVGGTSPSSLEVTSNGDKSSISVDPMAIGSYGDGLVTFQVEPYGTKSLDLRTLMTWNAWRSGSLSAARPCLTSFGAFAEPCPHI